MERFLKRSNGLMFPVLFRLSKETSIPSEDESGLEFPGASGSFLLDKEDLSLQCFAVQSSTYFVLSIGGDTCNMKLNYEH